MTEIWSSPWMQRTVFVVGGLLLGILVEVAVVARLKALAERTTFRWDDIIVGSIRGVTTVCLAAGGVYLALGVGPVDPFVDTTVRRLLVVLVIASLVLATMRLVSGTVVALADHSAVTSPTLVVSISRLVVGILGFFIILQNLDINITPLITALGIGGLAVALALQDTLGNLFAGMQIILSRQVRTGDYIRLASGEEGFVTDVKGRNTTIQTFPDGNLVVVPNSSLASSIVKNFTLPRTVLWVSVNVGVSYDSDLEHVEAVTLEVARQVLRDVEGGVLEKPPLVLFHAFGDSSIDFEVRMMVSEFTSQGVVRHEFIKRLHRRFNEEGIQIPFPIRTLVFSSPLPGAAPATPCPATAVPAGDGGSLPL